LLYSSVFLYSYSADMRSALSWAQHRAKRRAEHRVEHGAKHFAKLAISQNLDTIEHVSWSMKTELLKSRGFQRWPQQPNVKTLCMNHYYIRSNNIFAHTLSFSKASLFPLFIPYLALTPAMLFVDSFKLNSFTENLVLEDPN